MLAAAVKAAGSDAAALLYQVYSVARPNAPALELSSLPLRGISCIAQSLRRVRSSSRGQRPARSSKPYWCVGRLVLPIPTLQPLTARAQALLLLILLHRPLAPRRRSLDRAMLCQMSPSSPSSPLPPRIPPLPSCPPYQGTSPSRPPGICKPCSRPPRQHTSAALAAITKGEHRQRLRRSDSSRLTRLFLVATSPSTDIDTFLTLGHSGSSGRSIASNRRLQVEESPER